MARQRDLLLLPAGGIGHIAPLYPDWFSAAPKELAWVEKSVRDASLKRLGAGPEPAVSADSFALDDDMIAQEPQGMSEGEMRVQLKKRKLYRQASDTTQIWFPFEMAVALAQELVWEAGGDEVKWVLHGTPAAGNVVLGSLEMNCNAIVFCEDSHHQTHFMKALTEKAAERLASGQSRVFGNPFLRAKLHHEGEGKKEEDKDHAK